jgi:Fic family protein
MPIEPAPPLQLGLNFHSLFSDADFFDAVQKTNADYMYWDKAKYVKLPVGRTHSELWTSARLLRRASQRLITTPFGTFTVTATPEIQAQLHQMDMQFGGMVSSTAPFDVRDKERYLSSSLMEEAIASSMIEGAATTRKKAKELLQKNLPPANTADRMVINNYRTIQLIIELKDRPLSEQELLRVHHSMTEGTLELRSQEGAIRKDDEVVVFDNDTQEVAHTPPSHTVLPDALNWLYRFFNEELEEEFIHPIIRAGIIHFMIGYLHPFADGNGRTARALMYWYLLRKGYWLTEYLSISRVILRSKRQYEMAYLHSEHDNADLTYFVRYLLRAAGIAYQELLEYVLRTQEKRRTEKMILELPGINQRQSAVLAQLLRDPDDIMTVTAVQRKFGVSEPTARTDLEKLVEGGWLTTLALNGKKRGYRAVESLNQRLQRALEK